MGTRTPSQGLHDLKRRPGGSQPLGAAGRLGNHFACTCCSFSCAPKRERADGETPKPGARQKGLDWLGALQGETALLVVLRPQDLGEKEHPFGGCWEKPED